MYLCFAVSELEYTYILYQYHYQDQVQIRTVFEKAWPLLKASFVARATVKSTIVEDTGLIILYTWYLMDAMSMISLVTLVDTKCKPTVVHFPAKSEQWIVNIRCVHVGRQVFLHQINLVDNVSKFIGIIYCYILPRWLNEFLERCLTKEYSNAMP